ncbi:MAG TPA: toll/interleukin-1 receptor domain-containing protein [Geminicoccaceae bacterium]|nr:toll/interleukin-1 receptor domain-containing protein [Geminicoccaceae bacterium]
MSDDDKKVFISYRRALSSGFARSVYQHLTGKGYDAFMDVESLDSGEFRRIILGQIKARPHFLALLTPGALVRTQNADDWMRQEIEHALELGRNVVPLLGDRFTFEEEQAKLPGGRFPGQLGRLPDMNAINVYWEYFDEAMGRLTKRFLRQPAHGPLVPTPAAERAVVQRLIENAARAQPGPGGRDWQWLSKTALSAPKLELAKDTPPGKRVWK